MTLLTSMFTTVTPDQLVQKLEDAKKENGRTFEPLLKNEFKVTADANDNGSALVRILPPMKDFRNSESPFVDVRKHFMAFKGAVYDSLCAGYFSGCPVCKFHYENKIFEKTSPYNKFNFGVWENKKSVAPRLNATEERWVNIYVIDDHGDQSNNGKIFQYKLPKAISDAYEVIVTGNPKINRKGSNPTDLMTGRDLLIEFYKKDGFRTYDRSEFLEQSVIHNKMGNSLLEDADFMEEIKNMQDLYELIDPEERMYNEEDANEKFDAIREMIEEEVTGVKAGNRIDDGFDDEPELKSKTSTKSKSKKEDKIVDTKEFEELTSGSMDSKETDSLEEVTGLIDDEDGFGDLDSIMDEIMDEK